MKLAQSPLPIVVRTARPEDLETLARFNEAMALETESIRLDPATIRAGVRAVLESADLGAYFVAERGGEPAGALLVTYEWSDWRNARFLWIQSVYTKPEHRRAGVFSALYRHVEALGRSPGHCGVRLYVEEHNGAAQETYKRLGMAGGRYQVLETPDRLTGG